VPLCGRRAQPSRLGLYRLTHHLTQQPVFLPSLSWPAFSALSARKLLSVPKRETDMLLPILVILLAVSIAGGGMGYSRFGYAGWSPAGALVLLLLVLLLLGHRF
jgi:hypothetical protein